MRPISALITLLTLASFTFAQHEPLKLHPDNPHYLQWRGKPTILITSGEHYGAVLNGSFNYIPYLDELQNRTLNLTRTFSGTYREVPGDFGITDNTLAPTAEQYVSPWLRTDQSGAGDGKNKFDLTKFNPDYFNRLKDFLSQASKRGVVVEYVLFCPFYEDSMWNVNPMNAKNNVNNIGNVPRTEVYTLKHKDLLAVHEAFVRKVVAELKDFDNLYYEICNEPYFGGVTLDWQARVAQTIVDAEKDFPHKHLIAQNIANDKAKVEKPIKHVSIYNFHYATPPDTVGMNYHLNAPIADDETGFRGRDDATYRTEAWEFILAGGAIFSHLDYSFTPRHPDGSFRDYKSPGGGSPEFRAQLKILKDFMHGFDFVRMKPANQIIRGGTIASGISGRPDAAKSATATIRALGHEGTAYALYIRGGTKADLILDLPNGNYKAEWLDTKTGKFTDAKDVSGDQVKLSSPQYSDDIALRIVKK